MMRNTTNTATSGKKAQPGPATPAAGQPAAPLTGEQVYQKIQQAIFEHRLAPGTQLVEERLVELSGLSRTKIRPILARLAHEHLVDLIPNRGAFIARPSVTEARELFYTRRLIEPAVIRLLCESADGATLRLLKQHVAKEEKARKANDRATIIRLSGEFHSLLAELAGNSILARLMHQLCAQTCLVVSLYDSPNTSACTHHHHAEILQAIEAKDSRLATQRMLQHLNSCENALRLEDEPDNEPDLASIFLD